MPVYHARKSYDRLLREFRLKSLACDPGCFGSSYEKEELLKNSVWKEKTIESDEGKESRVFFYCEDEHKIWSWEGLVTACLEKNDCFVYGLWVNPEMRNQNVAFMLLDECERFAFDRGCKTMKLNVYSFNSRALKFFEKFGFVVESEIEPGTLRLVKPLVS